MRSVIAVSVLMAAGALWLPYISRVEQPSAVIYWALGFYSAMAISAAVLFSALRENYHPSGGPVRATLGVANVLTLVRAYAVSALFAHALIPVHDPLLLWAPFVLYVSSITIDFFDGFVARVTGRQSVLGETLEHEYDSIGLIAATLVVAARSTLSWWFMLPAVLRHIFLFAVYMRQRCGLEIQTPDDGGAGRVIAGLYWGFIATALIPVFPASLLRTGAPFFVLPLVGAFLRDWLIVTGKLVPGTGVYRSFGWFMKLYVLGWLPTVVRVATGALLLAIAAQLSSSASVVLLACAVAILGGLFARTTAIAAIGVLAFAAWPGTSPLLLVRLAVALCSAIIVTGSGRMALSRHEDAPFATRVGGELEA